MLKINDALTLSAIAGELSENITGQRITKVIAPDPHSMRLVMRGQSLIIRTGNNAAVYLTDTECPKTGANTQFAAVLQKHISGGVIKEVFQPPFERILRMKIANTNELKDENDFYLYAELMGKYGNIILTDSGDRIISCLVRCAADSPRPLLSGLKYTVPEGTQSEEYIKKVIAFETGAPDPVWDDKDKISKARYIGVFSQKAGGDKFNSVTTVNAAADLCYTVSGETGQFENAKRGLVAALISAQHSAQKQKDAAQETMAACADFERDRLYGDIIRNSIYLIKPGAAQAVLTDFNDGSSVTIALDAKLSPQANAARYYKSAAKKQAQFKGAEDSLSAARETMSLIGGFLPRAEAACVQADIDALYDEIAETALSGIKGLIRNRSIKSGRPVKSADIKQLLPDLTVSGFKIYVGKNDIQNDGITFKLARKNDIWLHALGVSGSHVLIRAENMPVPMPVILRAAAAAAYNSKSKAEEKAAVDYTFSQFVKKQKGGRPGQVTYSAQKTVFVKPER